MVFIRLNRHLIGEVRELDAAVAQARARVANKCTDIRGGAGGEVEEMSVDLTVQTPRMVMWIVSLVCLPSFSLFSAFCFLFFVAVLGAVSRYQWHSIFFCL